MSRKMPAVEVNDYASIFTKPIFKNQNGEWYRDVGYADSLELINENFQGAAKSFIAIGYYLKHIKENELYREGNYQNIWECAYAEFGLSQASASRYMSMNDAYSVNGNTPMLDAAYTEFNKSQLQEMLALPEEKREEIIPEQTVSEIRSIAKEEKKIKGPTEAEVKEFYEIHGRDYDRSNLKELLTQNLGKCHSGGNSGGLHYVSSPRGVRIESADEITWAQLVKRINEYVPAVNSSNPKEDKEKQIQEQIPGQIEIHDFPEYLPDTDNEKHLEDVPVIIDGAFQANKRETFLNTKNIDETECIYCHFKWNGNEAINYDTSMTVIKCPKCGKEMGVLLSVEFECYDLN